MSERQEEPRVMIDLVKVSKTYLPDIQALADISLCVRRGEVLFLTGKSGAGKSTLLRLFTRMEKPSKGVIEVLGHDLNRISEAKLQKLRRSIGFAFQDFKLLPDRTVAQNISVAMEVSYTRSSVMQIRIRKLLQRLGLAEKYNTPTCELSRGEQQRVAIARALSNNPELILADEPTGNLDRETTGMVMDLFRQYNDRGATLVIATHDTSIYQNTNHRVLELREGRLIGMDDGIAAEPSPSEPAHAFADDDLFTDE